MNALELKLQTSGIKLELEQKIREAMLAELNQSKVEAVKLQEGRIYRCVRQTS